MTKALTVIFAIIATLNGGLDQLPVGPDQQSILHWLFAAAMAGIGVYLGPAAADAVKQFLQPKTE